MHQPQFEHHFEEKSPSIDELNRTCYDHRAETWNRFPFPEVLPQFVLNYSHSGVSKRVLDIGSGTGILAEWLSKKGFDVTCIDPSFEMVRRCRTKGLYTIQCTIQEYIPDGTYGMNFCYFISNTCS
jgi:2-polyprenyl-3-methyl-5-hydroxy-6-metoxy-1,4-benzoquinol methylase